MVYLRYIDDIFMRWKGSHDKLQVFLKKLKKQNPIIRFYGKVSREEIAFLAYSSCNNLISVTSRVLIGPYFLLINVTNVL